MKRGILLSGLVIILLASFAFVGCGAPPTTAPTAPATPTTPATPAEKPAAPTAPAKVLRLKFSETRPSTSGFVRNFAEPWSRSLEQESGGRVKIDIYYSQTLLKTPDTYDGVVSGVTDMSNASAQTWPGRFPLHEATLMPFLFETTLAAGLSMVEAYEQGYFKDELKKGVKLLSYAPNGPAEIVSRTKYIKTLEDWKGLRIQSGLGWISATIAKLLGGVSLGISSPEMYEAMERGLQDVSVREWEGQYVWKVYEVAKYRTGGARMMNGSATGTFLMNLDTYNNLPADIKAIIDKRAPRWNSELTAANFDRENVWRFQQILEYDKKVGNPPVYNLPAEERNRWQEALKPIEQQYVAELEKTKGLGAAGTETLNKLKEFSKKYSTMYPPGSDAEYEMWKKYGYEALAPGLPKDFFMPPK